MREIVSEIITSVAVLLLAVALVIHQRNTYKRLAALSLALVEEREQREKLAARLEELDPQGGIDTVALEKAFNEGVQRIMDYGLSKAMGGGLNG